MSAIGMHMPTEPTDIQYVTYGVVASQVELDVLTGGTRVLKIHIRLDMGSSYNPMVDMNQLEGAYILKSHVLQVGMDYDHTTGKLLTDNTWTYEPVIPCDLPEVSI